LDVIIYFRLSCYKYIDRDISCQVLALRISYVGAYEPNSWMPHITLVEHYIQAESLKQIMARLSTRVSQYNQLGLLQKGRDMKV